MICIDPEPYPHRQEKPPFSTLLIRIALQTLKGSNDCYQCQVPDSADYWDATIRTSNRLRAPSHTRRHHLGRAKGRSSLITEAYERKSSAVWVLKRPPVGTNFVACLSPAESSTPALEFDEYSSDVLQKPDRHTPRHNVCTTSWKLFTVVL